jgi:1-aminocyclopropane-1-carboxylate synthase 1/2/6
MSLSMSLSMSRLLVCVCLCVTVNAVWWPFGLRSSIARQPKSATTSPSPEPVLSVGDVNFQCEQDLYHPVHNPTGYIHFGTAMNRLVMEAVLPYLPAFVTTRDTVYQQPAGSPAFRAFLAAQWLHSPTASSGAAGDQLVAMSNVYAMLSAVARPCPRVAVSGATVSALAMVAEHSGGTTATWSAVSLDSLHRLFPTTSPSAAAATDTATTLTAVDMHLVVVQDSLDEAFSSSSSSSSSLPSSSPSSSSVSVERAVQHFQSLTCSDDHHNLNSSCSNTNKKSTAPLTVFVLANASQLAAFSLANATAANANVLFVYSQSLLPLSPLVAPAASCAVATTTNASLLQTLRGAAFFSPVSSALQAAALLPNDEESAAAAAMRGLEAGHFDALATALVASIAQTERWATVPDSRAVFFGTGGSALLDALGRVLFVRGDRLALDAPFYSGFVADFVTRSGLQLEPVAVGDDTVTDPFDSASTCFSSLSSKSTGRVANTLQLRAKRAWEDGCRGFLVCNPHNPTGRVYPPDEIAALCEWATSLNKQHPQDPFHLIFDELYAHSVHSPQPSSRSSSSSSSSSPPSVVFQSAIPFSVRSHCVHVVRGFAKDFGLCGFKTGYGFSSNPRVLSAMKRWRRILQPSPVNAWLLLRVLQQSRLGSDLYDVNARLLSTATERVTAALRAAKIPFVAPRAGVFVWIDLSKELRSRPEQSEYLLWKNLLRRKRVNIAQGSLFGGREPGWFRLCPFCATDDAVEGIRRIGEFLDEEYRS